jgi:hypothetical protein
VANVALSKIQIYKPNAEPVLAVVEVSAALFVIRIFKHSVVQPPVADRVSAVLSATTTSKPCVAL